ncbi:YhgE/Pip domain-containing protein [Thermoactinospora rubra]|uniref:YhgE/Pip domain-containing protein n=1 Tax=Thermoactinospora rubra TaxID=1088767 RepID=UPI000A113D72|nr:YhgE/Pip domain-containing protein [Thermoactinospora rubra]
MRELRRFTRSRLTRLALAAVVLLPLLYAGLYLWSFWDPQGHLDRVPVALVMEDRPSGGLHAGRDLAEELHERKVFDWHDVTAREAADGVRDGSFYLSLTIPADFSRRLRRPPAHLGVEVDTGRSYIMGSISDAVFGEVRAAAARTAIGEYFDQVFLSFGDIHDKTVEAADGASRLHDGTRRADDGAARLNQGLGSAESGVRQLSTGLGSANSATARLADGSSKVTAGLATLEEKTGELRDGLARLRREGTRELARGSREAYEQVHAESGKVNQLADRYVPLLNEYGPQVAEAAEGVADAADAVVGGLEELSGRVGGDAQQAAHKARAALDSLPPDADPRTRELLRAAADAAERAASQAATLDQRLGGASELPGRARELARVARRLAAIAPELGPRLEEVRDKVNQLDAGLARLAEGAATVDAKLGQAAQGATKLADGVGKLHDGSAQVSDGLGRLGGGLVRLSDGATRLRAGVDRLHDGAGSLDRGLDRLADGSKDLADGLSDGAGRIPDYDKRERQERAADMSDPVRLAKDVDNAVPNYGTGFAPFFVPLALWVGAMIAYMVLRPLNPRLLAGTRPALSVALAGWLPAVALGFAQVGVLLAVLRFGLGLEAAHWAGVAGLLLLTTAAFLALVQAVNALLGPPGRVAALALLMLQLTSAAGTYPIETSPGFFRTISPWLPMSWVVAALRRLVSGGDLAVVWQACGVLTAFLILGLSLTVLAVTRGRTWTPRRLHPELSL